ncbi:MAG TPA: hypothetical protein VEX38_01275, partial [Fimbriimonadaceae bacterium]|nr:hypothetical protein [Fimbriimonadaceae bacterium]
MRKVLVSGLVALCLHCGAGAQGEWSPPKTSLPEAFIEAAARMHRLGLASGKGGEYRKFIARIPMNIPVLIIPDAPQQQTGWVLPRRKGEPLRAVGWDGLVYEVDRLGPRANLLEDVQAWPKKSPGTSRFNVGPRLQGNLLNLAVLLLAGEVRLVERLSTKIDPPMEPFGQLLLSFLWNLESRALRAHVWGFHEVALHDLELIDSIGSGVGGLPQDFLADTRRRVTSRTPKLDLSTLKRLPQQRRIQLLVNALEDVRHDTYDPIVLALEREGDPAVDSLLWAMEKDTRLTRISGFNSAGAPTLRSVSSVASSIVSNIIGPTAEPKTLSARERWSRVRPMSRVQRALHVLSEEYAEPQLWAVAAQNLLVKWNLPLSLDYLPAKMPRPEPKALTPATIELLERRALRSLELGQVWQAQLLAR